MNGILNYAAPRARCPKAMTFGILSAGVASLVCALPAFVNATMAFLQSIFAAPGKVVLHPMEGAWIVLGPTLVMLALPLLGLLFAGMSVASSRRDYDCAMVGIIVNISGLLAGVGTVLFH